MDALLSATLVATVKKIVDTFKFIVERRWNELLTQTAAFVAGILATLAAAQTDLADAFLGFTLGAQSLLTQVFLGVLIGGSASVGNDVIQAFRRPKEVVVPVPVLPVDDTVVPVDVPVDDTDVVPELDEEAVLRELATKYGVKLPVKLKNKAPDAA